MGRPLHRIRCLFLIVLMVSMFSLTALAAEGSAELDSLHFDIALQEDGSACITEMREVVFNGDREFTRYGVNNVFAGPRTFTDWQATVDGTPLTQLDAPDNENRPENSFAVEDGEGENTIYIYFRQQGSGTRIFQIGYRVENAVKLYSDVGEFFWNLTGETGISDIGTLTVTLTALRPWRSRTSRWGRSSIFVPPCLRIASPADGCSRARRSTGFWHTKRSWPTAQTPSGRKRSARGQKVRPIGRPIGPSGMSGQSSTPFWIPSRASADRFVFTIITMLTIS